VLEHAQRGAEVSEAVSNIASNHLSKVSGTLRIAAAAQHFRLSTCAACRRISGVLP
jgi:hypothetical protein